MTAPSGTRVALVTGGSRGIGAAAAIALARAGHDVAITYLANEAAAKHTAEQVESFGRRAVTIQADQGDADVAVAVVERTVLELGGLTTLVLNAGLLSGGQLGQIDMAETARAFAVNVTGVLATVQAAQPHLGEGDRVIVIGSANADAAFMPGMAVYASSKAAVQGLVRALAHDLAGVGTTVNVIQPGPVDTDMNPDGTDFSAVMKSLTALGRYGTTDEIASAVTYLASPGSAFMTGSALNIDGGMRI